MASQFPHLEPIHRDFILRQRMFFTASAASTGRVNLSPKGLDSLRVLGPSEVIYLDLTGSLPTGLFDEDNTPPGET